MIKKTFTINALAAILLAGGVSFTQSSCSRTDRTEVSQDGEQAYNDFKTFVTDAETRSENVANESEADYNQETTQLKSDFDTKVAAVDKYADQYDDARRQEIEQLRTRYTTAYDKRDMTWKNRASATGTTTTMKMGKYYKPMTSEYAAVTPQNVRAKYEAFTAMVKANENRYDIDDWRNVNADWKALDDRYDVIKDQVSTADREEIAKEKAKYAAFKSFDKTEARVAEGADAVGGAAKDVAGGAKEVGKDVGQGAKKVGSKVGNAVKGAYKEVKSEVKNTDND
ncbi:hypothetical protein PK28_08395 [Hymenobacter sp. DG25B]|uniref:DUF6565 domain-containing protein n=1 Tax=Hymenobacter sp. DG25B TaxID=1385664 RepID=UPI000541125F|nr:DUF6565 domain-containing protein [Hymenobacter sp. DG25B]AIZ63710.1 hypothetical protein PK28_08395 [Hymenobacter sp. DG25B]